MQPRDTTLPVPTSQRYWSADLGAAGLHHFRFPYYGLASQLLKLSYEFRVDLADLPNNMDKSLLQFPLYGAIIGACWHHRAIELSTPPLPPTTADLAKLKEYGVQVMDELQDEYDIFQLLELFNKASEGLNGRYLPIPEAVETADFTQPQKEEPTT